MISKKSHTANNYPWLVAFFIWPLGAFLVSIRVIGKRVFSVTLVLFYFLYGFTYVIAGKDQDTYRTSQYFAGAAQLSFSDLWTKFTHLYELGSKPDIFQDILQFLVSRFTQDIHIYFAVTAVFFAVVSALIFEDVLKDKDDNTRFNSFVLLLSLFLLLVLSPGRINSFRHYLATALFLFSAYRYLQGGGIKYLVLLLITSFIHFAFVVVIPLIGIYKLVGNRFVVYYVLIFLSFIYADQVSDFVGDYTTNLDESALQYHANRYTSDVYLKQVEELKTQRYYILDKYLYFTTLLFFVITLLHYRFVKESDDHLRNLFAMCLLIFAFVNFFSDLESIANRFGVLYQGFCCIFLIHLYLKMKIKAPLWLQAGFGLILLVNGLIAIRILMQSASVSTVLLFFPVSLFSPVAVSILDWIK